MTPQQKAIEYAVQTNCNDLYGQKVIDAFLAGASFVSQNRDEEMIEFMEWALAGDYRLNPHCKETRWRHKDTIGEKSKFLGDGITSKQLHSLFIESKGGKK